MKKFITLIALMGCISCLSALGKKDMNKDEIITETGVIQMYGNMPFSFPGIVTEEGKKYTISTDDKKLMDQVLKCAGKRVLVKGTVNYPENTENKKVFQMLKDGFFLIEEIEIVKTESN